MKRALLLFAALAAFAGFGYTPVAYTNSFTRDGVTYVQRGALGTSDYVATNIDSSAVGKVQSVNSKTGDVVLVAKDIGAVPTNITEEACISLSELLNLFPNGTTNGVRMSVNGLELDILIDTNANMIVFGDRKLSDYGITDALKDDISSLTNSVAFTNAVAKVSPPTVLPDKWALSNVTNKNGSSITAKDVGAWSTEKSNTTTNWMQELVFNLPNSDERLGYIKAGMDTEYGGDVCLELWNRYNDFYKMVSIDSEEIYVFDGENSKFISWSDILRQNDVQQAWSQLWNKWEKPISAKGVYTYLTNQYYTSHLDSRYYTKTAADLNFLSKLTAAADYMAKTGTYTKAEMDANFLNVTSHVEKIYANDDSRYINGQGEVYDYVSSGYYWDLEDSYYHDHFIFVETNGVDGFYCPVFEGSSGDARLKFEPSRNKWCLYIPASQTSPFSQHNGMADSTTIEIDPFGTATKHSAGGAYVYAGKVALTNSVPDASELRRKLDMDVYGYGPWDFSEQVSKAAQSAVVFDRYEVTKAINSGVWRYRLFYYYNGTRHGGEWSDVESETEAGLDDVTVIKWTGGIVMSNTYTRRTAGVKFDDRIATTNQIVNLVPNTRTINGKPLTNDLEIAEMDYDAMTNTVNEVKEKFYDQPLQVEWTLRMVNGDMKLYATTNVNTSVLNN